MPNFLLESPLVSRQTTFKKVWILIGFACLVSTGQSFAQGGRKNLAAFDAKKYHFGFCLAGNQSDYNIIQRPEFYISQTA